MQNILNDNIISNVRKDNCFDFLRYLFAVSLIIAHFCTLTGQEPFWFITGCMRVKAFFTITGFLVTYSFLRRDCEIKSYAIKRFMRIVPAYICCIVFCVLIGWMVTRQDTVDFFSSAQTIRYTLCNLIMLNWLEPELPETFQSNLVPEMNGSLWSMKQEVLFYIMVPCLIWFIGRANRRGLILIPVLLGVCLYNFMPLKIQFFMYFFSGMFILLYFDIFSKNIQLILYVSVLMEFFVYVVEVPYVSAFCNALDPIAFSSMIVGIAYNCRTLNFMRKYDNVTYGLYLYHIPIIQVLILYGVKNYNIWLCLFITFLLTSIMACLSWFVIEKPFINHF